MKSKAGLLQFLAVTKDLIHELRQSGIDDDDHTTAVAKKEYLWKLCQIRDVLDHNEISGINRKLQMKPQKWMTTTVVSVDTDNGSGSSSTTATAAIDAANDDDSKHLATEILLILKWGGDLTPLGREQAESVGARFRQVVGQCMYYIYTDVMYLLSFI